MAASKKPVKCGHEDCKDKGPPQIVVIKTVINPGAAQDRRRFNIDKDGEKAK